MPTRRGGSRCSPKAGTVQQPLMPTFFSSSFGLVTDRFGVSWMVVVDTPAKE